jgi:hypothetical protein
VRRQAQSSIRLATYNVWNAKSSWSQRLAALVEALGALNAVTP